MAEPIVSISWLYHHLLEPAVRIVDLRWYLEDPDRGSAEYDASHIPGAIFLDVDRDLSAPEGDGRHPLPDPQRFGEVLGGAGIGNENHVIAYDDAGGAVAARLWWMLRHVGHDSVSVLDGGFAAWTGAEYPTTAAVYPFETEHFEIAVRDDGIIARDDLRDRLGSVLLLDARSGERYEGRVEPIDPEAGHIPTAVSAPHTDNLTESGLFRPAPLLAERYRELGVAEADEVVVYCGSGVNACHTLLALELAGITGATLYPGSWSDWSTAGYPVATGTDPGSPPN